MTPGNLVRAVANAFEISESEVTQYDRRLLEAGLRTKGGRGASAPDVTPDDAARLVIAALLRMPVPETVTVVTDWWFLPMVNDDQKASAPSRVGEAVANHCEFGKALASVIADCVSGEMESFLGPETSWGEKFCLRVILQDMRAEIEISDGEGLFALAFGAAHDDNEPRSDVLTTHLVAVRPLLSIAEQMRQ